MKIAVAARLTDGPGIYILNQSGGRTEFIPYQNTIVALKWPSSDSAIAALVRHGNGKHYIWLLNTSGVIKQLSSRAVYIPKNPSANLFCWSRDARAIVFASDSGGNVDLWCVQVSTGREKRLTDTPGRDYDPAWSPDGSSIAFTSERTGYPAIWIIPSSGGNARRLVYGPGTQEHPTWSRDGRYIAFVGTNHETGIYSAPISGGPMKAIAVGGHYYAAPVWSSTGKWIAYVYGRNPANLFAINVGKTSGWGPNYQTSFDHSKSLSAQFRTPVWAPDRDQLVFASYEDGRLTIRLATFSEKFGPSVTSLYTAPRVRTASNIEGRNERR